MNLADAAALKKKGNDFFGRGKYADAVEAYTAAIDLWMETHDRAVLYSNRSAARLKIAGEKQKALSDAERAVQLDPKYAKAHFRKGQALRALGDAAKAVEAMEEVLKLEPSDGAATVASVRAPRCARCGFSEEEAQRTASGWSEFARREPSANPKGTAIRPRGRRSRYWLRVCREARGVPTGQRDWRGCRQMP